MSSYFGSKTADHADHHDHHPTGWRRWLYSTNHKDIGTMYLVFSMIAGLLGGAASVYMRAALQNPGLQLVPDGHFWHMVIPAHGLPMLFLTAISAPTACFSTSVLPPPI